MGKFEGITDVDTYVRSRRCLLKETIQIEELAIILLVTDVRVDRHSIVEVESKRQNRVIDDTHVLSIAIQNDIQILDEKIVHLDAVLPIETLFEDRISSIDVVENVISVLLFTCSENNNFVILSEFFKHILNVRAQSHLDFCPFEREFECRFETCRNHTLKFCSDKGLIHVENKEFILCPRAKLY